MTTGGLAQPPTLPAPTLPSLRLPFAGTWFGERAVGMRALARDALAIGVLAAVCVAFFWPSIVHGLVAYENDTRIFYFPLFRRLGEALKQGQLPLWSPEIFGGYPIFADGEAGSLYPPHLMMLLLLPAETAFTWLRPVRFFQAAVFTYLFCRTLRIGRFGSATGGLTFAFSGFSVAQMHHTNISTAAVWLPLILAFCELALRGAGRARYLFALMAGVAFGLQGLIIHVQVVLMTALMFAAYCGYRCIVGPVGAGPGPFDSFARRLPNQPALRHLLGRPLLALGVVTLAGAIGGALSAVQLLPLYELGTFSFRGGGVNYAFASQYSLPPAQLISFLLPEFYVAGDRYWGLWSRGEVVAYAGITPLVLAIFGIVLGRRRGVLVFLAVGIGSLAMAMGESSPFGIHRLLAGLPGFAVLRAPGRFVYLVSLSIALLAALGADALSRSFRPKRERAGNLPVTRQSGWSPVVAGLLLLLVQVVAIAAPIAVSFASSYVEAHKPAAVSWLQANFMRMRGFDGRLNVEQLYLALSASLDITQPSTLRQLALLIGTAAVLLAWDRLRSARSFWQGLLVMLISVDLIAFGRGFHPVAPFSTLAAPSGVAEFLARDRGLFRVFTQKGVRDEPNSFLGLGIAEANGYSSLEPDRHTHYASMAEYAPSRLLDMMNARFYAVRNAYEGLPSHALTAFNPRRPLVSSTGRNPAGDASFALKGTPATVLRVVSTMRWATAVSQGTDVALLTATTTNGQQHRFRLQAGVHTAEWAWERPDLRDKIAHQKPPVARTWEQRDGRAQPYPAHFYFGEFAFPSTVRLQRVDVELVHPTAQVEIYGLAAFDDESKELEQLDLDTNDKLKRVYSDRDMILYENQSWLPRAWLVPSAVIEKPSSEILTRMAQGDFSPERLIILEEQFNLTKLAPPAPAEAPIVPITFTPPLANDITSGAGRVNILAAEPEQMRMAVEARQPAMLFLGDVFYPGWRAYVDGQETQIYRANYIFRAIFVPAGQHSVEFVYRPRSFRLGLLVTLGATAATIGALLLLATNRLPWTAFRSSATISVPGSRPVSAPPAATAGDRDAAYQKGPKSNGRQVSEGDAEKEHAEAGDEGQESAQVASAPAVR
ncbi:MAG TPA: YfhO family protein, partial [Chloroflexota bacterium]|nr:YfhO family protein [Chloroflexota bacterium]